jgi:hypothetical protein
VRLSVALLLVAGCSFKPGTLGMTDADEMLDAAVDDPPFDVAIDAPKTWQIVETLMVDSASSTALTSTTVLATGVTYRLRASGTVTNVIDDKQGDAEWWDFADPKDNGCCEDIGLGINDLVVNDLDTQPNWGAYNATHIYEVEWIGAGGTITALYQDTYYGNNGGIITLEILEYR